MPSQSLINMENITYYWFSNTSLYVNDNLKTPERIYREINVEVFATTWPFPISLLDEKIATTVSDGRSLMNCLPFFHIG